MTTRSRFSITVLLTLVLAAGVAAPASGAVRLPAVFGDHMVIQQDKPVIIWGWAAPQEVITVRLAAQEAQATAGADGRWKAVLPAVKAGGGPSELTVTGSKSAPVVFKDVLAGEVWLCSGQSNMEWWLASTFSSGPEVLRADDPMIRLFNVPKTTSATPLPDVEARWTLCTPKTAAPFSAVAYYFGLELHNRLGVPVGLIESAWGGTDIEPWTPPAGFAAVPETMPLPDLRREAAGGLSDRPGPNPARLGQLGPRRPQGPGRRRRHPGQARRTGEPLRFAPDADGALQRHGPWPGSLRHPGGHLVPGREQPQRRPAL